MVFDKNRMLTGKFVSVRKSVVALGFTSQSPRWPTYTLGLQSCLLRSGTGVGARRVQTPFEEVLGALGTFIVII